VSLETDAVAGPWAVVVHSHDALSANTAVVRSRRPDCITLFAEPKVAKVFALLVYSNGYYGLNVGI
jgi:hypothetical protein